MSAHPSVVPFQFFATADGFVAVACPKEKFWRELVRRIDLPDLVTDDRFDGFGGRRDHRDELIGILAPRFAQLTTVDWLARLRGHVPIAPMRSLEEALDETELAERGMLVEYDHPVLGTVRSVGLPLEVGGFEPPARPGPQLAADRDAVLTEGGFTVEEIAALERDGAFGRLTAGDR
jgi:crotonobetainyl-CoA:carnitine CoA-transferase CaiB-like acyl-CoA transferase